MEVYGYYVRPLDGTFNLAKLYTCHTCGRSCYDMDHKFSCYSAQC